MLIGQSLLMDLVLRDIPGDITSIGYQRIQNLNQSIAFQAKLKNSILTVEHQSYQSLNPIITDGYKKSPSVNFIFSKKINGFYYLKKISTYLHLKQIKFMDIMDTKT